MKQKNILLAGSSGLVGSFALKNILQDRRVSKIILIGRRQQNIEDPRVIQIITELDKLETIALSTFGIDHIDAGICALGSTIKKAGGQETFKQVDCRFALNAANFAKKFGATHFSVVSALGANKKSSFFYNRVKAEMEEGLRKMDFFNLTIIRPSLILGERKTSKGEQRYVENFFIKISPLLNKTLIGPLKKYRGIEAHKIASYLSESVFSPLGGEILIENSQMLDI